MSSGDLIAAEFTFVESPEPDSRGLVVRHVPDADKKAVRRWGGYLFATVAEAEAFGQSQMQRAPWARGRFAHIRVDGLRIYVRLGGA